MRHQHDRSGNPEHSGRSGPGAHAGRTGHGQQPADPGHADHAGDGGHGPHRARGGGSTWATATSATLHCLTGCAIGEVLGMVIGTTLGWGVAATIALAVALAFVFGYALTMWGVLKAGVGFRRALKVALAADTVSILVMEVVDNAVMVVVPGAMEAGLSSGLFWGALAFALAVAFVLTVPVNKWLIGRGGGHAVVHAYHH